MIHMGDLIMKRGDYRDFDIAMRKDIFRAIYHFSRKINVCYKTIIVNKKYINKSKGLKQKLSFEINNMVIENEKYLSRFDKIVVYYDNGQEALG